MFVFLFLFYLFMPGMTGRKEGIRRTETEREKTRKQKKNRREVDTHTYSHIYTCIYIYKHTHNLAVVFINVCVCLCHGTYSIMRARSCNHTPQHPEANGERNRGPGPSTAHQELRIPEATHPDGNRVHTPQEEGGETPDRASMVKGQEPRQPEAMSSPQAQLSTDAHTHTHKDTKCGETGTSTDPAATQGSRQLSPDPLANPYPRQGA